MPKLDIQIQGQIRYNLVLDMLLGLEIELKLKQRNVLFEIEENMATFDALVKKDPYEAAEFGIGFMKTTRQMYKQLEIIEMREREVRSALSVYVN